MQNFDVAIVGGGMVGLALGLSLAQQAFRVAIIEKHPPDIDDTAPALRVSAFNLASQSLFEKLGVWENICHSSTAAYKDMFVWEKDSFANINFSAIEQGVEHLGVIAENKIVQQALWRKALDTPSIKLFAPNQLEQVAFGENEVFISLNQTMITAKLVVAADGAHSSLRRFADIPVTFRNYRHHALMARIKTSEPHLSTARQIFSKDSILAFLPQAEPHMSTIVWSVLPDEAERLASCDEKIFCDELAVAFDFRLGHCQLDSPRQTFPLIARFAHHFAQERLVLLGDAAHTIHPLAGQGVNLGLMDAALLSEEVSRLRQQGKDFGQHYYLARYERERKHQALKMLATMQGFHDLFAGDNPIKKAVRDVGMKMINNLPNIKHMLMEHALGFHDMPEGLISSLMED